MVFKERLTLRPTNRLASERLVLCKYLFRIMLRGLRPEMPSGLEAPRLLGPDFWPDSSPPIHQQQTARRPSTASRSLAEKNISPLAAGRRRDYTFLREKLSNRLLLCFLGSRLGGFG